MDHENTTPGLLWHQGGPTVEASMKKESRSVPANVREMECKEKEERKGNNDKHHLLLRKGMQGRREEDFLHAILLAGLFSDTSYLNF